jgi:PAS domain S-box-containing protein
LSTTFLCEHAALIEAIPAPAWVASPPGEVQYVNAHLLSYLGASPDDVRQADWLNAVHPHDLDRITSQWRENSGRPAAHVLLCRLRSGSGLYRWFEIRSQFTTALDGKLPQWLSLLIDVEEKILAQAALNTTAESQDIADRALPALLWEADPDGSVTFVNDSLCSYLGMKPPDLVGNRWTQIVHPEDVDALTRLWNRRRQLGQAFEARYRIRRADGAYCWIESRCEPKRRENGSISRWIGVRLEIDSHRKSGHFLTTNAEALRKVLDAVPAMIWCATADGGPIFNNKRLADFTGVALDRLDDPDFTRLPTDFSDDAFLKAKDIWKTLIHPADYDRVLREGTQILAKGVAYTHTYRLHQADGEYRWFNVRGEPMLDESGRIQCWFGFFIDIDDQRKMEDELKLAYSRLSTAEQVATIAELSASIAHEVNQPLAAVVANAQACQRWLSDESFNLQRAKATVERIVRDGRAAAEILRRTRSLFKHQAPILAPVDINNVISEMKQMMQEYSGFKDVIIDVDLTPGLPLVEADKVQVQQVLANLMRNAAEAMRGENTLHKRVLLRSRLDDGSPVVDVCDSGPGLSEGNRAFDAFFSTKLHGIGMGLPICKTIIETHRGRLWVTQNDPRGAIFSFTLAPLV